MAQNPTTITSQDPSERPIAFILHDEAHNAEPVIFDLAIRPEELTRSEPARSSVTQTLGGAWLDAFGEGVGTINISGTTGWGAGGRPDGHTHFIELHKTVWKRWHELRAQAAQEGKDPSKVRLIFSDGLDDFTWEVSPDSFTLRRSKTRPLLHLYQISMTKLGEAAAPARPLPTAVNEKAGLASLDDSIGRINKFAGKLSGDIKSALGPISSEISGLVRQTQTALTYTRALAGAGLEGVRTVAAPVLEVAQNLTRASANVFHIAATIEGLPMAAKNEVMGTAAAFTNAMCLLRNAIRPGGFLNDYTDLYGSSNCSSTAGGSPLSPYRDDNVFMRIYPASTSPVLMTAPAEAGLKGLMAADPVNPPSLAALGGMMSSINSGLTLSGAAVDSAIAAARNITKGGILGV